MAKTDEAIEIAVREPSGAVVFHHRLNPKKRRIHPEASAKNGITLAILKDEPHITDVYRELLGSVGNTIIFYNSEFDSRLLAQTCQKANIAMPNAPWRCAMKCYAAYCGEVMKKSGDGFPYRYRKLPGADHSTIGDCRAVLTH